MLTLLAAMVLAPAANTLTPEQVREGWQLLFDGRTTAGWRNYRGEGVRPGWRVEDGVLTVADPANGGDIVTEGQYEWFELLVDVRIPRGQNSGIMFHVAEGDDFPWMSGPEIQIFDHQGQAGSQRTGFLYDLVSSPVDASRPTGEWNTIRLRLTQERGSVWVNGTHYYDFVLDGEDFRGRVARSKFGAMPNFARVPRGHIALQGDHGVVSFRNIKLRTLR